MILKRLGPRIWQHINVEKHSDLFFLVVLHPAFLNEIKSLPGYKGKDVEIVDECTVSCRQLVNNKDIEAQRLGEYIYICIIVLVKSRRLSCSNHVRFDHLI